MNKQDIVEQTVRLLEEFLSDEVFYVITMQTYDGRRLYLKSDDAYKKEWTFNKGEAIWFETYTEAEAFANKWFKNFKNWEIREVR